MMLSKSDVGNYTYSAAGSARPHALQSVSAPGAAPTTYAYDANGNLVTASAGKYRSIAYTSFNLPDSQNGIGGETVSGASSRYTWVYDENHQRIKETRTITGGTSSATSAGTRTTWYLHPDNAGALGFEQEVNSPSTPSAQNPAVTSNRHYFSFGGKTLGVMVTTGSIATTDTSTSPPTITTINASKLEYWHKDHLGSLVATTDHSGAVTARYAYDPFGKRRFTNGSYDPFGTIVVDWSAAVSSGTDRGFTEHEHLDDVGIIHMNGRLFDPTVGRFLQADPFVQDPGNLQNFNRYGYCFQNPLTCTDPTGMRFAVACYGDSCGSIDIVGRRNPFRITTLSGSASVIGGAGPRTNRDGEGGVLCTVCSLKADADRTVALVLQRLADSVNTAELTQIVCSSGPAAALICAMLVASSMSGAEGEQKATPENGSTGEVTTPASPPPDDGDRQKKGKPERNVDQNKRVDDAAQEVGLDKQQRRELGRYIEQSSRKYGENFSYNDILDAAQRIKDGERLIHIK